jgi:hypothetical protein
MRTGMIKNANAGISPVLDAGMPMLAASILMTMPSYGIS